MLLTTLTRGLTLYPSQNPGDRWISKLHNYSRLKELSKVPVLVSGTKLPLFERMDCSRLDRERVMEWLGGDNEK